MTTTHRIATGIAAALALALAAAAPASATPWDPNSRDPSIPIRPAPEPAMIAPAPSHASSGPVVVVTERDGFNWSDAGIGAAGGLALALIGGGGAVVVSQRPRRNRQPTPLD